MNNIFDLRRFSLEDGDGIRTVIFFKGCPLRCKWCHNPESFSFDKELKFISDKCTNCKKCLICPRNVHSFNNDHLVDFSKCNCCGLCTTCSALSIVGKELNIDDVVSEVLKDKGYYDRTNGGVTISGGEAMANFDGLLNLSKALKSHNINIYLETSGQSSKENFEIIMPYIDTFLYDYKHSDKEKLKHYTKGNLEVIENNLEFLLQNNKEVILRCPLIDSVNFDELHLKRINELSKDKRIKRVEVLPYHSFGEIKYNQINNDSERSTYKVLERVEVLRKIKKALNNEMNEKIIIK